jgi:hypothetical protein
MTGMTMPVQHSTAQHSTHPGMCRALWGLSIFSPSRTLIRRSVSLTRALCPIRVLYISRNDVSTYLSEGCIAVGSHFRPPPHTPSNPHRNQYKFVRTSGIQGCHALKPPPPTCSFSYCVQAHPKEELEAHVRSHKKTINSESPPPRTD